MKKKLSVDLTVLCSRILFRSALGLSIFVLSQGCGSEKNGEMLKLRHDGKLHHIVIADNSDQIVRFAAVELKEYLEKIVGNEFRISYRSGAKGRKNIIQLEIKNDRSLKWDGFIIKKTRDKIHLLSAESRGLLYAVYCLLEEAGCSFVYPGKEEEIVPEKEEIVFTPGTFIHNPVIEHRGLTPYGLYAGSIETGRKFIDWMAKNRMNYIMVSEDRPSDADGPAHAIIWKEVGEYLLPELQKRGFIIDMSEHCMPVFFPKTLFKDHPEWWAMNDGERKILPGPYSGQMCYSNEEAVEFYASAVAEYSARHPEFRIIGTWPLDGGEYCECENCKDPETIFKAALHVAEKVREVRPDMLVEHLAYHPQSWQPPETLKIPDNMTVMWCPDPGPMDTLAHEWIRKTPEGKVYQFEYFLGDNYRYRTNVWLRPGYAAGVAYHAREMGFRGVVSLFLPIQTWWRSSFNNWFFARACWQEDLDVRATLTKYCMDYYGEQGKDIERVFNLILNDLQAEPYQDSRRGSGRDINQVRAAAGSILSTLDSILANCREEKIEVRIQRLKTYVEYFLLQCEYESIPEPGPADRERLVSYSRQHPGQNMVLMYPEYIKWRN